MLDNVQKEELDLLNQEIAELEKKLGGLYWVRKEKYGVVPVEFAPWLDSRLLGRAKLLGHRNEIFDNVPKKLRIAEVGILKGDFSRIIFEKAHPCELHLIDNDLSQFDPGFLLSEIDNRVFIHNGDSSNVLEEVFSDSYFDIVYIDADHTFIGVSKDIKAAKRKVKPGGLLAFNDYMNWSPLEAREYGVMRAVNELIVAENWHVAFFAFHDLGYHDIVVQRPRSEKHWARIFNACCGEWTSGRKRA
jgi:SAM-dependent methyltransferase